MEHTPFGKHGGASRCGKLRRGSIARTRGMRRFGKRPRLRPRARARLERPRDRRALAAASPRRTCSTTSSRSLQHHIGCRLARRVIFPDSIPPERLRRFGVGAGEAVPVPGPEGGVLPRRLRARPRRRSTQLGSTTERVVVIVRPPPDVSLYHRKSNPLFPQVLDRSGTRRGRPRGRAAAHAGAARATSGASPCPRWSSREHAVDAQSLVALADLVVSAGGTMNREAVALGTPSTRPTAVGSAASTRR